jgi:hypothetical protein
MPRWSGKIRGTINSDFEDIEADTEEEAREAALMAWQYVEYEDLEVDTIEQQEQGD